MLVIWIWISIGRVDVIFTRRLFRAPQLAALDSVQRCYVLILLFGLLLFKHFFTLYSRCSTVISSQACRSKGSWDVFITIAHRPKFHVRTSERIPQQMNAICSVFGAKDMLHQLQSAFLQGGLSNSNVLPLELKWSSSNDFTFIRNSKPRLPSSHLWFTSYTGYAGLGTQYSIKFFNEFARFDRFAMQRNIQQVLHDLHQHTR